MKTMLKGRKSGRITARSYGITKGRAKRMIKSHAKRHGLRTVFRDNFIEVESENVDMWYSPSRKVLSTIWWNE
ncbi:hypothetical protein [Vibrio phage vB_ValA_R15Z]|uniref:Uncharacterized protein n=1 Tax=Vibrio phage vB_ValA_R15Z TaxID=3044218 RepID=A0AA49X6A6_9CAUD|nr:hypothetical protein [Vibrio phage vB_ValA_R15Z]